MAEGSDLEKSEAATGRRIDQAREEGQVPQSKELQNFLLLTGGVGGLWMTSQWMYQHVGQLMQDGLTIGRQQAFDPTVMEQVLARLAGEGLLAIAPLLVILVVASFVGPLSLGGFNFSSKVFQFNFSRMNPLTGVARMFSLHGVVELFKSALKAGIVGGIGAWLLWHSRDDLLALMSMPLESGLARFGQMLLSAAVTLVVSLALVAAIDVPFQLWQYYHQLKMSKEELKQESKESEGDPKMKGHIRSRQRAMARRR
ncbi:MAG TPA: EscU/YscU/HrcU family type III secretion system export apparatus switch protein, partial [Rhodocyclaceae bacterium]|nr:EscU/YscU/HrcU family type III secretion system export apparatus switch protein [Rhodocyclaceae bacterium]